MANRAQQAKKIPTIDISLRVDRVATVAGGVVKAQAKTTLPATMVTATRHFGTCHEFSVTP